MAAFSMACGVTVSSTAKEPTLTHKVRCARAFGKRVAACVSKMTESGAREANQIEE